MLVKASLGTLDPRSASALHHAARRGYMDICLLLLSRGANLMAFFTVVRKTGIWPSQSIRNSVALIIVYVFALLIGKVFVPSGKVADK